MSMHAPSSRTLLVGGAVAVGGVATAASAALRRSRHQEAPVAPVPFESRTVAAGLPLQMSPQQLDAALAASFPGDETPGYL